jgi:hypothetical protein
MPTESQPRLTAAESPETLPLRGFSAGQLCRYIRSQLGEPVWNVELTNQQILDTIQDGLSKFGLYVPMVKPGTFPLVRGQFKYLEGVDIGQGIKEVDFVEPNPVPTEIFYGNLINPAPLFRVGIDEYDTFLRWRKSWQRVTSVRPDWFYDDTEGVLYIHNPIERYSVGVQCYFPYERTEQLKQVGSEWVKDYALERSRYLYGEILAKYGSAIPGPLKDIQLDSAKRDKAEARIEKLLEKLQNMQTSTPISID